MHRALSVRSHREGSSGHAEKSAPKHRFTMSSLRGINQPEMSKKLYKLIKSENHAISAYENAAKQQASIATQLSEWGEDTGDDAISDISDKLGVLLSEIAEQEDGLASGLEEGRGVLKQIRNTESSVQPSRDHKAKIQDEIQKLKYKEPSSTKIVTLEQELVRAEAQSLVAEAQLTNITRQKIKESFDILTAAYIERAEKQILLAKNARKILNLLDDTPVVPGDAHPPYENEVAGREILNMAEEELRAWQPNVEPIHSSAGALGSNAMPISGNGTERYSPDSAAQTYTTQEPTYTTTEHAHAPTTHVEETSEYQPQHSQLETIPSSTAPSTAEPPYPVHEEERVAASSTY
ncbi:hypothetical protein AAFC00_001226 [Neodothiora populina]|uniref:Sphingolipid long chain base-responsive protein LSP1 n=1 Tax=Neodothiora populina TaxID=2781224 RepID=A0ABR3PP72_9PEZI